MSRFPRTAAAELMRVAGEASAWDVWRTACAVFMLQAFDPRRFVSDKAFQVQLGRRVRHLATVNRGTYYDHSTGHVKAVYRDANPRVAEMIGVQLAEAFGAAGVHLAGLDQADRETAGAEREALYAALDELDGHNRQGAS